MGLKTENECYLETGIPSGNERVLPVLRYADRHTLAAPASFDRAQAILDTCEQPPARMH